MGRPLVTLEIPWSFPYAYTSELISRLRQDRIYDPDFALSQDPKFYATIERDGIIPFLVRFRAQMVAGIEWGCDPASEAEDDKQAAAIMDALLGQVEYFSQARQLLSMAFLTGSTWARIGGEIRDVYLPIGKQGGRRVRAFCVTQLRDVGKRRFALRRLRGTEGATPQEASWGWHFAGDDFGIPELWQSINPDHWVHHTYHADEASLSWGRGLAAPLYWLALFKTEAMARGMSFLERWAEGWLTAQIDIDSIGSLDQTTAERVQQWITLLKKMRSQHVAVHGKEDEIKVIEGSKLGWEVVQQAIDYADDAASRLVLGSILPTGGASDKGSLARAAVESDSTAALVAHDREQLSETITKSIVGLLWRINRPLLVSIGLGQANMPRFVIRHSEAHKPEERAGTAKTLIDAGLGGWMKPGEVLEASGFTLAAEGEETIVATPATDTASPEGEEAPVADQPAASGEPPVSNEDVDELEDLAYNGAQISSAIEIVKSVTAGELTSASAIEMLSAFFSLPRERAEAIVASAPQAKPPETKETNRLKEALAPGKNGTTRTQEKSDV